MSLVDHLTELRSRIIKSLIAVAAGAVVGFFAYDQILDVLLDPYCDLIESTGAGNELTGLEGECRLFAHTPTEGLSIRLKVSVYAGIALAMPVLCWQLWRFVTPALTPKEKRYAVPFVASAIVLFALGAALAYWTVPRALEFLLEIAGDSVSPLFAPAPYITFITFMLFVFGLGFEFPILLVFMQLAGIVEPAQLKRFRRYSIVLIVAVVAIITPSGDPISLLALSVPMYLFYEVSILIGRLVISRRG